MAYPPFTSKLTLNGLGYTVCTIVMISNYVGLSKCSSSAYVHWVILSGRSICHPVIQIVYFNFKHCMLMSCIFTVLPKCLVCRFQNGKT